MSVVPNAPRTIVDGTHDSALRVRLAAPPVDGRANNALVAWAAKSLRIPKTTVRVKHGQTSRRKVLEIDLPADVVAAWIEAQLQPQ